MKIKEYHVHAVMQIDNGQYQKGLYILGPNRGIRDDLSTLQTLSVAG